MSGGETMMTGYGLQKLALGLLVALAGGALGCGGGGGSSCSANVAAEWFVTENGVQVACLPGDEVDINVDDMTATFACSAGAGTTPALAGGFNRNISLTLFDASSNVLSQTPTNRVFVPCGAITDIGSVEFSLTP
jgi:hypothetical protein